MQSTLIDCSYARQKKDDVKKPRALALVLLALDVLILRVAIIDLRVRASGWIELKHLGRELGLHVVHAAEVWPTLKHRRHLDGFAW